MGKLGRFACILTPMLCTLASLICIVVILIAGTKQSVLPSVYLLRVDTRNITVPEAGKPPHTGAELGLQDFYTAYLWNTCTGDISADDKWTLNHCNQTSASYAFNLENLIDPEDQLEVVFPENVDTVQKAVNTVYRLMAWCYAVGAVATLATFVVGWFGLLSRWGSCVTTIIADAAFFLLLVASISATFLAYSMKVAFNENSLDVAAVVGQQWILATWIGTGFSLAASIFWMMSMCCCSGRTRRVMGDKNGKGKNPMVEHAPYTYERVSSPYKGLGDSHPEQNVPMLSYNSTPGIAAAPPPAQSKPGFEPFRHSGH